MRGAVRGARLTGFRGPPGGPQAPGQGRWGCRRRGLLLASAWQAGRQTCPARRPASRGSEPGAASRARVRVGGGEGRRGSARAAGQSTAAAPAAAGLPSGTQSPCPPPAQAPLRSCPATPSPGAPSTRASSPTRTRTPRATAGSSSPRRPPPPRWGGAPERQLHALARSRRCRRAAWPAHLPPTLGRCMPHKAGATPARARLSSTAAPTTPIL
jgi:hypothetical protein